MKLCRVSVVRLGGRRACRRGRSAGLGTISEIFDGDPPHAPKGCIAQAWSVAELLRATVEDFAGPA